MIITMLENGCCRSDVKPGRHIISKIIAFFMTFSVMTASLGIGASVSADTAGGTPAASQGLEAVAENESLKMYFDGATTEITVENKITGAVWRSNPEDRAEDKIASPLNINRIASQLLVSYYDSTYALYTIDNYSKSIANGDFKTEKTENGIKVTYTLSENRKTYIFPSVISAARMDKFCEKLSEKEATELKKRRYLVISLSDAKSEDERKEMKRLYSAISEDNDVYTVRETKSEAIKKSIHELFEKAGYNADELNNDNKENGIKEKAAAEYNFVIPIVYQLDGADLIAYIPGSEIKYNSNFPISTISLLPFFGAAGLKDEGYIFVPDGSGALINFNNGRTNTQGYYSKVYGDDYTVQTSVQKNTDSVLSFPVFGICRSGSGMLAVIEDGEADATITADISGKVNSYNTVYATFEVLRSNDLDLGDVLGTSDKIIAFAKGIYDGSFRVRYRFPENDPTYSGMAASYRDYLESNGLLDYSKNTELPLITDMIGSIDKAKSFMGIAYRGEIALTTFDQCAEIADAVCERGVTPTVRYSGWMNGGMTQSAATAMRVQSALGGIKGLSALAETLAEKGIALYPDVSFQYSYGDKWFDGFSKNSFSARDPSGSIAQKYSYNVVTGKIDKTLDSAFIISPVKYSDVIKRFTKKYKKTGIDNLSVNSLGSNLNTDFDISGASERQRVIDINKDAIKELSDKYSLMCEGANQYAAGFADYIVKLPVSSNQHYICDLSVPFIQMVLHSAVSYTGDTFNLSDNMLTEKLKAIETGSGLYVSWIYADNSQVKNSNYSDLYAMQYLATIESTVDAYKEIKGALEGLEDKTITAHSYIADSVTCTQYEDGTKVYVNYNDSEYQYENITIEANSYKVCRG